MSEYGCITNTRTFAETTALYQTDMTSAFSGGLVYEYSQEGNGYGLVTISGSTVTPVGDQFSDLQSALANVTNPSGNGGATNSSTEQDCPAQSDDWDTSPFTGSALPATPSGALKYFEDGAGTGPGLNGTGSQDASGGSSSTASSGAGAVSTTYSGTSSGSTSTSTSTKSGAAAPGLMVSKFDVAPLVCGVVVVFATAFGAALL